MEESTSTESSATLENMKGAFVGSLMRNNKKIRDDRAIAIAEDAELIYKRAIEDTEKKLRQFKRDRDNMLDLSAKETTSLIMATDFNADEFVAKDLAIGTQIRNLQITLEIAKERYDFLFVKTTK
jgi:hypothetical protein